MKARKRVLGVLLGAVMTLAMTSAVFAAENRPDTITLPNGEVREIPTVEMPNTPAALSEEDTSDVVIIDSVAKFDSILEGEWYSGKTFKITQDLNLTGSSRTPAEWGGYIKYFYGNIIGEKADGSVPVISGLADNCGLIYGIVGGNIENVIFQHTIDGNEREGGSASFIAFMPTRMNGADMHLTMKNVTITGNISLTGADQSNYAPFIYAAPQNGMTMENCINEANINGNIYGSVFHGYYPLNVGPDAPYEFIGCRNEGKVTLQYAGMFFGNSSSIEGKVANDLLNLTIQKCKNTGEIRGTSGAKFFAAPVSEFGPKMEENVENLLNGETPTTNTEPIQKVEGKIPCTGDSLEGFKIKAAEDGTITITRPANDDGVDHYVVTVAAYVNLWNKTFNRFDGTDRVSVIQTISKDEFGNGNEFVPELKAYGFADDNMTDPSKLLEYSVINVNGKNYYLVEKDEGSFEFELYVSKELGEDNMPVGGGTKTPDIISVAAYSADNVLLDTASVVR